MIFERVSSLRCCIDPQLFSSLGEEAQENRLVGMFLPCFDCAVKGLRLTVWLEIRRQFICRRILWRSARTAATATTIVAVTITAGSYR
jgi:hypothetical protein